MMQGSLDGEVRETGKTRYSNAILAGKFGGGHAAEDEQARRIPGLLQCIFFDTLNHGWQANSNPFRIAIMARKNPHIGSSFESWLEDIGIREEVTAAAIKAVIARQLASEMRKRKITKQRMAELMKTSRAQIDRLLDPDNGSATIESLQRAAKIVGRELRLQLV
jgi:predicted XRE-type DNA-binding protein